LANMIPPESVMDPRYAAWKKAQDDAEAFGIFSDIALTAIPFAGVAAKGAMAAGRILAPTAGMAAESYMNKIGGLIPLDVYHGTPHRFPPTANNPLGEFDASKIGTGEGAQAYGHGLYLAENPQSGNITTKGNLYKVDLPDKHIEKMLDWDKPLSQQSKEVQALLQKAHQIRAQQTGGAFGPLDMNQLGKDVIPTLGEQRLQQAGIPGIRYLDQSSRSGGASTSNFVVFDPAHMNIIGRE